MVVEVNNIFFCQNRLNKINELLRSNLWYKYFKTVLEIDTWIDFEMEIEYILNQFLIFNKYTDKSVVKRNFYKDEIMHDTNFNQFDIVEFLANFKFKLNSKYINTRKGIIDVKKILDDLAKSFEDFIVIFNRYLVDIISVFYSELKQKSEIPIHLMNEIYTFNYTPTLERFYNVEKSKVVYLHGQINEDNRLQNMVLGVSDISIEIKASKIYNFTKYYQKIIKKSNKNFIEVPKALKNSLSEIVFYIIGHSLDESDKEYITDLFKFLEFDHDKYSKICVFCYDKKDQENKLKNLLSIIDKDFILEMNRTGRLFFVELNAESIKNQFSIETYKFKPYIGVF